MIPWSKIGFLGDSIFMLPLALFIMAWLAFGREWRLALRWGGLFACGLALVAATKIAFIGWGIGSIALDFTGISGHAMRAAAVLPVLAYLATQKWSPPLRRLALATGLGLALLIGMARVVRPYHSVSEVVAGFLLGSAISLGFLLWSQPYLKLHLNRWVLAASLLALVPTAQARPAPTEHWVKAVALYLSGHDRPYVRGESRLARQATPMLNGS